MLTLFKRNREGDEKSNPRLWIILIGAVLGVGLLLFGGNTAKKTDDVQKENTYSPEQDEMVLYQRYLEGRVKTLCESVSGIGDVTVIVTLSGSFESVYATELTEEGEEYVIVGSGSSAQALFLSREAPSIAGVGIVCGKGSSAAAKQELISLVSAALNVPTNRIYITE